MRQFAINITACALCFWSALASSAQADYDTLIQQSLVLRNAGEFLQAEEKLREAMPLAAETNEVAFLLAMVLAFQERFIESNQLLDQALEKYPGDIQLNMAKARVLSYQGQYSESIDISNRILAANPDNLEARNLLARVYYYQRRYADAKDTYTQVLSQYPDDLEALIGMYDTELAAGNSTEADTAMELAAASYPDHVDVITRRDRAAQPPALRHELNFTYSASDFDFQALEKWYDKSAEYRFRTSGGNQIYIRAESDRRYGLTDSLFELGGIWNRQGGLSFELAAAFTPDDEFLPSQRVRIGTSGLLMQASESFGSTTFGLSLTDSRYTTGAVQWLKLDLTHYFLSLDAWITPGVGVVQSESGQRTVGWNMGAHWQAAPSVLVGFNYTDAPETELGITTETSSRHGYVRVNIFDTTTISLDASRVVRQNSYTRDTLALSLQYRF